MQSLLNVPAEVVPANINATVAKAAAKDIGGKVLAIFFPILAFVVSGFEHCVANMYYIPAGFFIMVNFCRLLLEISLAALLWLAACAFICMGRQRDNGNIEMEDLLYW